MTNLPKSEVKDIKKLICNAISGCYEQIKPEEFNGRERFLVGLIRTLCESEEVRIVMHKEKCEKLEGRISSLLNIGHGRD